MYAKNNSTFDIQPTTVELEEEKDAKWDACDSLMA